MTATTSTTQRPHRDSSTRSQPGLARKSGAGTKPRFGRWRGTPPGTSCVRGATTTRQSFGAGTARGRRRGTRASGRVPRRLRNRRLSRRRRLCRSSRDKRSECNINSGDRGAWGRRPPGSRGSARDSNGRRRPRRRPGRRGTYRRRRRRREDRCLPPEHRLVSRLVSHKAHLVFHKAHLPCPRDWDRRPSDNGKDRRGCNTKRFFCPEVLFPDCFPNESLARARLRRFGASSMGQVSGRDAHGYYGRFESIRPMRIFLVSRHRSRRFGCRLQTTRSTDSLYALYM
jgi:hypothetical protein